MNLLEETRKEIVESGHTVDDIAFIGSADGQYACSYAEFEVIADVEYDNGYGSAEVAGDLVIRFTDGNQMWRSEYDGSEWWEYDFPRDRLWVGETKPITHLLRGEGYDSDLKKINEREATNAST